jgi:replication factor C small subunit
VIVLGEVKLVRLKKATYDRLRSYGKMGDTMDSLLSRLLDEYEELKAKNTQVAQTGGQTGQTVQTEHTTQMSWEEVFGEIEEVKVEEEKPESWTDKYRPKTVDEMVGEPSLLSKLKSYVKTKNVPNVIFYGKEGCGKTTAALCLVNEILNGHDCLMLNAVKLKNPRLREEITKMAERGTFLTGNPYKICIIDGCESMGQGIERELRTLMEEYSDNIRFILICNDIKHKAITQAIKSRCDILEFKPLSPQDIYKRLSYIASKENVKISNEELLQIAKDSDGDMRKAIIKLEGIAKLQRTAMAQ